MSLPADRAVAAHDMVFEVLGRLADVMARHYLAGRRHLLTEDVFRFATVALLEEHGVAPGRLAIEAPVPGGGRGKLDLVIDNDTAIEFKFPRDPAADVSAADTMTFGELLADVYRLGSLPHRQRLAVWLVHDRLAGYLSRAAMRYGIGWPVDVDGWLELPTGLRGRLPATAAAILAAAGDEAVKARMIVQRPAGDGVRLAVLSVVEPGPRPWPPVAQPERLNKPPVAREVLVAGRAPAGVRREILDAIDAVTTRSGSPVFAVRDIVTELERRGTRYALSTVTTMVTSHMCVDGNSPTQWPDLRRVDRGLYRRVRPGETR